MPNLAMLSTRRGQFLREELAEPATQTGIRQAEGVTQKGSSTG
jgi:hypothetical protein